MLAESPDKAPGKSTSRSKVTNGSKVGTDMDGRTIWVRRLRDLIEAHTADLGGDEALTQAQKSLVRRAATLSVELERMEAGFATAGQILPSDLDGYQRASNTLRRHLEVLGLRDEHKPPQTVQRQIEGMAAVREALATHATYTDTAATVGHDAAGYEVARRIAWQITEAGGDAFKSKMPANLVLAGLDALLAAYKDRLASEGLMTVTSGTPEAAAKDVL